MSGISSRKPQPFDISAASFKAAAGDIGEVIAFLAGGVRPDPETLSRLTVSLRALQGFLIEEADDQAGREAIGRIGFDIAAVSVPFVAAATDADRVPA